MTKYEDLVYTRNIRKASLAAIVGVGSALSAAAFLSAHKPEEALSIEDKVENVSVWNQEPTIPYPDDDIAYEHTNDTLILHLKPGKHLSDVEMLRDSTDGIYFSGWEQILDGVFLVDPAPQSDHRIHEIINRLEMDFDVEDAEFDYIYSVPDPVAYSVDEMDAQFAPHTNDPLGKHTWAFPTTHMDKVWEDMKDKKFSRKVRVVVLDTGRVKDHEDLPDGKGYDVTKRRGGPGIDKHSHGTHVYGTICAHDNNGVGIPSYNVNDNLECDWIKALSDSGRGSMGGIAKAIRMAGDLGYDIGNMSLGGRGTSRVMAKALQYSKDKGVIWIVAAGNDNSNKDYYSPAGEDNVVPIGSCVYKEDGVHRAFYSNWNTKLCAPGGETRDSKGNATELNGILSTVPRNSQVARGKDYLWFMGTSMASPNAAGLAAVILGYDNFKHKGNPQWMEEQLAKTGDDIVKTDEGKSVGVYVNANNAVNAVK